MTAKFVSIKKDEPEREGRRALMVAIDDGGSEVLISGRKSQDTVRKHVQQVAMHGIGSVSALPGDVGEYERNGHSHFIWSLPEERQQRREQKRDPISDMIGIAHHQAWTLIAGACAPDDLDSYIAWHDKAQPHAMRFARAMVEDRLALQRELVGKS